MSPSGKCHGSPPPNSLLNNAPPRPPRSAVSAKIRRKVADSTALEVTAVVQQRLVEYFVVVSSYPRWTDARSHSPTKAATESRDESIGGNIHLPQHQSKEYTFCPRITARYPQTDYTDNPLNQMITQFCYPHSDSIVPSTSYVMPRIHYFVLTNDKGRKIYGTCLTVHEEYFPAENDPYSRRHTVHSSDGIDIEITFDPIGGALYVPRVLCILSAWPYLLAFREYLTQLYRFATTTDLMTAPIERYVQNLCVEIPAPPPGAFEMNLNLFQRHIKFWAPPAKLPVAYVALPYHILFECLDLENVMVVWYALLTEQKVVLLSSHYSILTVCAEVLQSLMFPLKWSHLYVPLLPRFLSPMLDAPIPYLVGAIRENWMYVEQNLSADTIVVDLDCNDVSFGKCTPKMVEPPTKKWTKLKKALEESVGDFFWKMRGMEEEYINLQKGIYTQHQLHEILRQKGDAVWKEKSSGYDDAFNMAYRPDSPNLEHSDDDVVQSRWEKVQEAFLRFFVSLFKFYRKFLHLPNEIADDSDAPASDARWNHQRISFDREGFVAWHKYDGQDFYRVLSLTQQFDDFITKRLYSPGEPDMIFFDQSIESKLNRSKLRVKKVETPLLLNAKAHKVLQTIQAVQPTNEGLEPRKVYRYESWPDFFDSSLFGAARPIPSMITAEFDRQASLVARLRASHENCEVVGIPFRGSDFDPSPEAAVFTVFFFTYCAVVGTDWQAYQRKRRELLTVHHHQVPLKPSISGECNGALIFDESKEIVVIEKKTGDAEYFRCDRDVFSGMIVSVPNFAMRVCELCPGEGIMDSDLNPFCSDKSGGHDAPKLANEPILEEMDDNVLAAYEEAREIASAQLDLAFEALSTSASRGLSTDLDAFRSLMEACGRCGNTDRAIQLIRIMKRDGFVADSEIYACFLSSFAQIDHSVSKSLSEAAAQSEASRRNSCAYSVFLKKKLIQSRGAFGHHSNHGGNTASTQFDDEMSNVFSESTVSDGSVNLDSSIMSEIYNAVFSIKPKQRRKKKMRNSSIIRDSSGVQLTDRLAMQNVLGESLLSYLKPDLVIDTSRNSCPQCSSVLTEDDVVAGWNPCEFQDFTSRCPNCKHNFIPHFTVTSSKPGFIGTQGEGTPLYCEFLSPWVLRQELEYVIHGVGGVEQMLDPEWRRGTDIRASLWWNLIVHFRRYHLPVAFLLQGSFHNRLINPTP